MQAAAETMVSQLVHWIREDDSDLGVPRLPGAPPSQELGRPMMLMNVLMEYCGEDSRLREKHATDMEWSVQQILKHVSGYSTSVACMLDPNLHSVDCLE